MKSPLLHRKDRQAERNRTMIFPLTGLLIGAVFGAFRAKQRGGKPADMMQWGVAFAVMFGLLGLFVLIIIERSYT